MEAPDPASDVQARIATLTRVLGEVRQYMVLRVWQVASDAPISSAYHFNLIATIVASIDASGLLPPDFMVEMIRQAAVVNPEAERGRIITVMKGVLAEHLAPVVEAILPVKRLMIPHNLHDMVCLLFEFSLVLRLDHVVRSNAALRDPATNRIRRLVRPRFVGNDGQVFDLVEAYKRRDPKVVLEEALAEKKRLGAKIAWARRRINLAGKAPPASAGQGASTSRLFAETGLGDRAIRAWAGPHEQIMREVGAGASPAVDPVAEAVSDVDEPGAV